MSDVNFPSGQWVGFYTYTPQGRRYLMDLFLEFRDGAMKGEGSDGIGFFAITGRYDAKAGECSWCKTYVGRHSVEYFGYREKKGIWGTWTIASTKGGFHIWPIGEGAVVESMQSAVEESVPFQGIGQYEPTQPSKEAE